MWVPVEAAQHALASQQSPSAEKTKSKPSKKELHPASASSPIESALKHLGLGERLKGPDRVQRYQEVMGAKPQKERVMLDSSMRTFSNVLANEYMALDRAARAGAVLNDWQSELLRAGKYYLKKDHGEFDWESADENKQYQTFFATFDTLLRSENADEQLKWQTAAMLATKHQVAALQMGTGAHVDVIHQADKVEHISDINALSAILATETGKSVGEIHKAYSKFEKFFLTTNIPIPVIGSIQGLFQEIYLRDPTAIQRLQSHEDLQKLMSKYEVESRKRLFSTVEIGFQGGGILHETALDPVQKEYIRQAGHLGTTLEGTQIEKQSRDLVEHRMMQMTQALQDGTYVMYDQQMRDGADFNLVEPAFNQPPGVFADITPLRPNVRSRIPGVGELKAGLGPPGTLDAELGRVMKEIGKTVSRQVLAKEMEGVIQGGVNAQISKLEEKIAEYSLSPADLKEQDRLEEEIDILNTKLDAISRYQLLVTNHATLQRDIANKKQELQFVSGLERDLATAQGAETTATRTLKNHKRNLDTEQKTISRNERIISSNETIRDQSEKELVDGDQQLQADTSRKANLKTEITTLDAQIAASNNPKEVQSLTLERSNKQTELQQLDARMNAWPSRQQLLSTRKQNAETKIQTAETDVKTATDNIEKQGGLKEQIEDAEISLTKATAEVTRLGAQLQSVSADRDALTQMELRLIRLDSELAAKKAQMSTDYVDIQAIVGNNTFDTDLASIRATVEADIKKKNDEISAYTAKEDILKLADVAQKEVLAAYRSEFLAPGKLHEIRKRARQPIESYVRTDIDPLSALSLAHSRNRTIPRPYLRMIQILGGDSALSSTPEGKKLFQKISKVATPSIFYDVLISNPGRENMLLTANGAPLPTDQEGIRLLLLNPDMQDAMMRLVDREFTQEILASLVSRANDGSLGELTPEQRKLFPEISQTEQLVKDKNLDAERQPILKERGIHARQAEWDYDEVKSDMVVALENAVQTAGFNPADSTKVIAALNAFFELKGITERTIPNLTQDQEQTLRDLLARNNVNVQPINTAQLETLVVQITQMHLTEQDYVDVKTAQQKDTELTTLLTQLNIDQYKAAVISEIRNKLSTIQLRTSVVEISLLDQSFQGTTLRDHLKNAVLQASGAPVPAGMGDQELVDIAKTAGYVGEASQKRLSSSIRILESFLETSGNDRDSLWLRGALDVMNADQVFELDQQIRAIQLEEKGPMTLDVLLTKLPRDLSKLLESRIRYIKQVTKVQAEAQTGQQNVNVDDPQVVRNADVSLYSERALIIDKRGRGVAAANAQRHSNTKRSTYLDQERLSLISTEIKNFNAKYWDKSGMELIAAIELDLGGPSLRVRAIQIAGEIESGRDIN